MQPWRPFSIKLLDSRSTSWKLSHQSVLLDDCLSDAKGILLMNWKGRNPLELWDQVNEIWVYLRISFCITRFRNHPVYKLKVRIKINSNHAPFNFCTSTFNFPIIFQIHFELKNGQKTYVLCMIHTCGILSVGFLWVPFSKRYHARKRQYF